MTAAQQDALRGLADIVRAAPVSMRPQTWAWAALAAIVVALTAWMLWRWTRYREANRYRVEALAALALLQSDLSNADRRGAALAGTATLLKRTALAAFPRPDVASLSGDAWVAFLRDHARHVPDDLARLLDVEYRPLSERESMSEAEARAAMKAAAHWIRTHHVSA